MSDSYCGCSRRSALRESREPSGLGRPEADEPLGPVAQNPVSRLNNTFTNKRSGCTAFVRYRPARPDETASAAEPDRSLDVLRAITDGIAITSGRTMVPFKSKNTARFGGTDSTSENQRSSDGLVATRWVRVESRDSDHTPPKSALRTNRFSLASAMSASATTCHMRSRSAILSSSVRSGLSPKRFHPNPSLSDLGIT